MEATVSAALKAALPTTLRYIFIRSDLSFPERTEIFHCLEFILNAIFNAFCAKLGYDSHQPKFRHCK